jgi:hypothetical protein
MQLTTTVATSAAAALATKGLAALRQAWATTRSALGGHEDPHAWRTVTVNRPIEEVEDAIPEPLANLHPQVEVVTRPAPGERGTEISARVYAATPGADGPDAATVRRALREVKQLLEVGWVTHPDANTTAEPTALNAPVRTAVAVSRQEGRR